MKVEIGKTYEICTTHIVDLCDTCSTIKVTNEEELEYVQAYADSPAKRIKVREIDEVGQKDN